MEQAGLTIAAIQTDAELKLRLAGIQVLSREEWYKEPGTPYLYLNANVATGSSTWGYSTAVELEQKVRLDRNPDVLVVSVTWSVGVAGYAPKSVIPDRVRSSLKDLLDRFINAYLSVNQKK